MRKVLVFIMLLSIGCLLIGCSDSAANSITVRIKNGYPSIRYYSGTSSDYFYWQTKIDIFCNEIDYTFKISYGDEEHRTYNYFGNTCYDLYNHCYHTTSSYHYIYVSNLNAFQDYSSFLDTQANGSSSLDLNTITKEQWEQADSTAGYAAGHYKELLRELSKYCAPITITCVDFHKDYVITDLGRLGDLLED